MQYRREIDGLRAIAVTAVILFHAGFGLTSGGYVGVDVFFVISGYLITSILLKELQEDHFSIVSFYERRARRILPALFAVILLCTPFAWIWMYPSQFQDYSQGIISVMLFVSNFLFWRQEDYFSPDSDENPLLHTWSLAVEEQYYIFFPILLFLLWRFYPRRIVPMIVLMSVLSLLLSEVGWRTAPGANFYLFPTRAWELLAGSLCAILMLRNKPGENGVLSSLGLILILVSILYFDEVTPFPSFFALVPVGGTALVVLYAGPSTMTGRFLALRGMVGIGLVSYSAYLWHQPLFAFARIRSLSEPTPAVMAALTAATFVLAYLSWRFVEMPFRRKPVPFLPTRARLFGVSGTVVAAFIAFGISGQVTGGFPGRLSPSGADFAELDIDARIRPGRGLKPECDDLSSLASLCTTGDSPRILVWGDSFAMHLVPALMSSPTSVEIAQLTRPVCAPVLDISIVNEKYPARWAADCIAFNDAVIAWLEKTPGIEYVVMSSPLGILQSRLLLRDGSLREAGAVDLVREKMILTASIIRSYGAIPVFVSPPPRTGHDLSSCAIKSLVFGDEQPRDCSFGRREISSETLQSARFLTSLKPEMEVVMLADLMCRGDLCPTKIDGKIVFRDSGHLSEEGSMSLGQSVDLAGLILAISE